MEYMDVVDENDLPLGITKPKSGIHRDGDWHRTVYIFVLNSAGHLLCNLRHSAKDVFPALWDLGVGGHIIAGESYTQGAVRELEEELGVHVPAEDLRFLFQMAVDGYDERSGLADREQIRVFLWPTDLSAESFQFQAEEIADIRFVAIDSLKSYLSENQLEFPIVPLYPMFRFTLQEIERALSGLPAQPDQVKRFHWRDA